MDSDSVEVKQNQDGYRRDSTFSDESDNCIKARLIKKEENAYIIKYKYIFLAFASFIMFGGFYNNSFQAFIKEQFLSSMKMNNDEYSQFLSIPPLPCIAFPILAGPLVDILGIRKGIITFSLIMLIGMTLIYIASFSNDFTLILVGKIIHQLGTENVHLTQSTIVTKWFQSSSLSTALAFCSFTMKLATSSAGIMYPELYDVNNNLYLPLLIGDIACGLSMICAIVVVLMDKKCDQHAQNNMSTLSDQADYTKKHKFNFRDIKQFGLLYWIYIIQSFFLWGLYYGFQGYAQPILITKFGMPKPEASKALSIVSFIALAAPIFGFLADRFAKRAILLIVTILFGAGALFLLLVLPPHSENSSTVGAYFGLVIFGIYLTLLCAYLWPSIPLFIPKQYIGTAFGICYAAKNSAVSVFSFIGGKIMGSDDSGYQGFLLFLIIVFLVSLVVAIFTLFLDKRNDNILDTILLGKKNEETRRESQIFQNAN